MGAVLHPIELEFGDVDFLGEGKPENPEKNLSEQSIEQATNLTHLWPEPGLRTWEASAITTTPSLLSVSDTRHIKFPLITQQMP